MLIISDRKRTELDKIVILIGAWRPILPTTAFLKKSLPSDVGYIYYPLPAEILNDDPELTRKFFWEFINYILEDIKELDKIKKREYYFYGQSLGGLFCAIISDKIKIKRVRLICPGNNLAESFWKGNYTRKLKKRMEKKKMTLPQLKKAWKDISPDNYFKNKSKKSHYDILLSKTDYVIPSKNGYGLIELLEKKNISFSLTESNLPHLALLILDPLFSRNSIKRLLDLH